MCEQEHVFKAIGGYYTCILCGECDDRPVFPHKEVLQLQDLPISKKVEPIYYELHNTKTIRQKLRFVKVRNSQWTKLKKNHFKRKEVSMQIKYTISITGYTIYKKIIEQGKRLGFAACLRLAEYIHNPTYDLDVKSMSYASCIGLGPMIQRSRTEYKKRELYKIYQSDWDYNLYKKSLKMVECGVTPENAFLYFHLETVKDSQKKHQVKKSVGRRCMEVLL
jgi:hypothetical protein